MSKRIEVSDETYEEIQALKRMWIEQTGTPINDDKAVYAGVKLFKAMNTAPFSQVGRVYSNIINIIRCKIKIDLEGNE